MSLPRFLKSSWRPGRLLNAWIALVVAGVGLHAWAQRPGLVRPVDAAVKTLNNIMSVPATPGWIVMRKLAPRRPFWESWGPAVGAHAISWALWLGAVRAGFALRFRALGRRAVGTGQTVDLSRRRLLIDGAGGAFGLAVSGSAVSAGGIGPWSLAMRKYEVDVADLPRELDGLRLAHLSDTHLGSRVPASLIDEAIEMALGAQPDLVCLVGDYVAHTSAWIEPAAAQLRALCAAPLGCVGVLGNHDWWTDGPAMRRALVEAGVRMIDNHRVFIDARTRSLSEVPLEHGLCVAGLGDLWEDATDLHRALGDAPGDLPRVVLAHNPDTAELPSFVGGQRVDLMLSGHTHGGQVRLPVLGTPIEPSAYGPKYAGGLVRGPAFPVLVSRGVGVSGVPVRIGVPPEVVIVTLRSR